MEFDFDDIGNFTKLVANGGSAIGQLASGLDRVKGLFKRSEAGTDPEIKLALADLTDQVANAKVANAELKFELTSLQQALREANAFKTDLERYELHETPAGSIIYRLRDEMQNDEPLHYLCPRCVEDKTKSILQGHEGYRECPVCTTGFKMIPNKDLGRVRSQSGYVR
ncbi:hypothetical protein KUV64_05365 [Mameliella alba]|uniref:hypothetical protein n=1 Tax=Mameliella alba TaxID=561184 RepID=UPI001C97BB8D|nr:hypothetical protein [Mameliella alba]MBY6118551.1 hypothetical protein [Mameliella alba]